MVDDVGDRLIVAVLTLLCSAMLVYFFSYCFDAGECERRGGVLVKGAFYSYECVARLPKASR